MIPETDDRTAQARQEVSAAKLSVPNNRSTSGPNHRRHHILHIRCINPKWRNMLVMSRQLSPSKSTDGPWLAPHSQAASAWRADGRTPEAIIIANIPTHSAASTGVATTRGVQAVSSAGNDRIRPCIARASAVLRATLGRSRRASSSAAGEVGTGSPRAARPRFFNTPSSSSGARMPCRPKGTRRPASGSVPERRMPSRDTSARSA